uniref:Putative leucine-rich repeat protein (LRRP) n=1 Tax=Trypanosoma congolense (strain IL3000) TaxID=1068625 RepID=G0UYQ5_TRYCI|nr:putative leucine-rich repeat protein (LRRP) [Trypanosoma congolense IL3000]
MERVEKCTVFDMCTTRPTRLLQRRSKDVGGLFFCEKSASHGGFQKLSPLAMERQTQGKLVSHSGSLPDTSTSLCINSVVEPVDLNAVPTDRKGSSTGSRSTNCLEISPSATCDPTGVDVPALIDCSSSSACGSQIISRDHGCSTDDVKPAPDTVSASNGGVSNKGITLGKVITAELLRDLTGWEDLHLVLSAEFRIDAEAMTGVDTISMKMPLLSSLKLNNSNIPQIRLLGANYMNLKRMWISKSHVKSLAGIGSCTPILEELYAAFNYVSDINCLVEISSTLQVLDLEGNNIGSSETLSSTLPQLKSVKYLTLQGNPLSLSGEELGSPSNAKEGSTRKGKVSLRKFIRNLMPGLQYLDDTEVAGVPSQRSGRAQGKNCSTHIDPSEISFSKEYLFVQQCIRECGFDALDAAVAEETRGVYARPQSSLANARPRRLVSNKHQQSARSLRPSCRTLRSKNTVHTHQDKPVRRNSDTTKPQSLTHQKVNAGCSSRVASNRTSAIDRRTGRFRQLPPLRQSVTTSCGDDGSCNDPVGIDSNKSDGPHDSLSTDINRCGGEGGHQRTCATEKVDEDVSLFADDDDEWGRYKEGLMRRVRLSSDTTFQGLKPTSDGPVIPLNVEQESGGLSSPSQSPSTRAATSGAEPLGMASEPPLRKGSFLESSWRLQELAVKGGVPLDVAEPTAEEEEEWEQELLRSVARTRKQTYDAAIGKDVVDSGEACVGNLRLFEAEADDCASSTVL